MRWCVIIVLTGILLVGCGKDKSKEPMTVSELLELFEVESRSYGYSLDILDYDVRFLRLPRPAVGRCWYRGRGFNRGIRIELDPLFWADADAEDRELLFFHELGHCVLGQRHRSRSIMAPALFSGYFKRRSSYISELFLHGADMRGLYDDDKLRYID